MALDFYHKQKTLSHFICANFLINKGYKFIFFFLRLNYALEGRAISKEIHIAQRYTQVMPA